MRTTAVFPMRRIHFFIPFFLPLVAFCFCLFFSECKNDPNQIRILTGKDNHEEKFEGITGIYSKKGKTKARLFAKEYIKHTTANPPYSELNKNLRMEFYDDSGKLEHVLTADSCRFYDASQNAIVWGNVKIISTTGQQLYTEELIWNKSISRFFTEKTVKIITGTEVLEGSGLEANEDFTWYQITHPNGAVQVKKGEMPQ